MIAIVDTGGANLNSLINAFQRLQIECCVSTDKEVLDKATHLVLPGVGHAKIAETKLKVSGLSDYLKTDLRPILGICLGFQLFFKDLEEGSLNEDYAKGLNILDGSVVKLKPNNFFTVPHMGWSKLNVKKSNSVLLKGISPDEYFYFVHSYAAPMSPHVTAIAEQNVSDKESQNIPAVLEYKNYFGTQFHPEKSGLVGEKLLKNFLSCNKS